jgi:hypothetical protein
MVVCSPTAERRDHREPTKEVGVILKGTESAKGQPKSAKGKGNIKI